MARIEELLVEAGATDISKSYDENKRCSAIRFRMMTPTHGALFFEIPANVDACFKVLWKEIRRPVADTRKRVEEQANRTAWKIVSDWVEVQVSMISLEQAVALQLFMPYVWNPNTNETLYKRIENNPKLLTW